MLSYLKILADMRKSTILKKSPFSIWSQNARVKRERRITKQNYSSSTSFSSTTFSNTWEPSSPRPRPSAMSFCMLISPVGGAVVCLREERAAPAPRFPEAFAAPVFSADASFCRFSFLVRVNLPKTFFTFCSVHVKRASQLTFTSGRTLSSAAAVAAVYFLPLTFSPSQYCG